MQDAKCRDFGGFYIFHCASFIQGALFHHPAKAHACYGRPQRQEVSMRAVSFSLPVMFVIGAMTVVATQEAPKTTDEQQLMQLERDWAQAAVNGDVGFLERIYHADHASVNPAGQLMTRSDEIADAKSGGFKAESASVDELRVRIYGGDTAVV